MHIPPPTSSAPAPRPPLYPVPAEGPQRGLSPPPARPQLSPFQDVLLVDAALAPDLRPVRTTTDEQRPSSDSVHSRAPLREPFEVEVPIDDPGSPSKNRGSCCSRWYQSCVNWATGPNLLKIAPVMALVVTSTGLYFGIRNYLVLEGSRATTILRTLGPILRQAHVDILGAIATIQREMGIPTMPPNGTTPGGGPPLPPPP